MHKLIAVIGLTLLLLSTALTPAAASPAKKTSAGTKKTTAVAKKKKKKTAVKKAVTPAPLVIADSTAVADSLGMDNEDEVEGLSLDELDRETAGSSEISLYDNVPAKELYGSIWRTDMVNPYNIRLTGKNDTTLIDMSGYVHPMKNVVTSEFGFRKGYRHHYGTDVRLCKGDSVLCAFDGMVRIAKRGKGYGFYVVVRHYNGLETVYGHFSKLKVTPYQEVKAGELLGYGGSTGRSSGPHLHYEIRYLGVPINPRMLIDFDNYCTKSDTLQLCANHFNYLNELEKLRFWTVRKGDTLGRIAQKTGISVNKLCQLNKIKRTSTLRVGQKIRYT